MADLPHAHRGGGVHVDERDIEAAFRFLDTRNTGQISLQDLKARLLPFYRDMPLREFKFLMGGSSAVTLNDLKELLADNDLSGFDPVAEAFKVLDPNNTGAADMDVVEDIFRRLGFEELSDDDLEVLLGTADLDHDGHISLEDFRHMLSEDPDNRDGEEDEEEAEEEGRVSGRSGRAAPAAGAGEVRRRRAEEEEEVESDGGEKSFPSLLPPPPLPDSRHPRPPPTPQRRDRTPRGPRALRLEHHVADSPIRPPPPPPRSGTAPSGGRRRR